MADRTLVDKVTSYIEDNIDKKLTLERIANEFHYSKYHLGRVFEKEKGQTIYQYIKDRRLTRAAYALTENTIPITDIAFEAHYNSSQAFCLAFQNRFHCSPSTYRKKNHRKTSISMYCSNTFYSYKGGMAA